MKPYISRVSYLLSLAYVPFLAVYPLLYFYSQNRHELTAGIIITPLIWSLAITAVILGIMSAVFRSGRKGAIFTGIVLFVFFSYGHLSGFLSRYLFIRINSGLVIGPDKILLPLLTVMLPVCVYKIFISRSRFTALSGYLSLALFLLVVGNLAAIGLPRSWPESGLSRPGYPMDKYQLSATGQTPDIYYLILDGYARNDILRDIYGFDNSAFADFLKSRNFYLATAAQANYAHTPLSLAASLNMQYLDSLSLSPGENSQDRTLLDQMVADSQVIRFFKDVGYTTINFNSGWAPTGDLFQADINYDDYYSDEFNLVFLRTTLVNPFISRVFSNQYRDRILFAYNKLPDIPYLHGPKFVMIHIVAPHPPYVFQADGRVVENTKMELVGEVFKDKLAYLSQLEFITKKTEELIDKLQKSSAGQAIVIIQADHGPASILGSPDAWVLPPDPAGVRERMAILNAYYLPTKDYSFLYQNISPVNTFRIILNRYFDQHLELLPDNSYFSDSIHPYRFSRI